MKMNTELNYMLLGRWLDTEFEAKLLANVSVETFCTIKEQMLDVLEEAELTDADVKAAWKQWFEWAAYNGTLINSNFVIMVPGNLQHTELNIIDEVLKAATEAIDNLPSTADSTDYVDKYVKDILDFGKFIKESLPPMTASDEEMDSFYEMKWTIGFGDRLVTIENEATIYDSMLSAVDEYIKLCL